MRYEWDIRKRVANLRKHGFDFRDAENAFQGTTLTLAVDRQEDGEERFITFGLLGSVVVAVAHTERPDRTTRIISMRKATGYEEKEYFEQVGHRLEADSGNGG